MSAWGVPASVRPHLESFATEAAARGVSVDTTRVRVRYVRRLESSGFCRQDRRPTLLLRRSTFGELDSANQQALLFHELGHCLLDRRHDERRLPNGEWASLMRSGGGAQRVWIHFEGERRGYYLDELFGLAPVAPAWSSVQGRAPSVETSEALEALPSQRVVWTGSVREQAAIVAEWNGVGSFGLVLGPTRPLAWMVSAEDGLVVQVLGEPRPWFHRPDSAADRLWLQLQGEYWVFGAGDEVVFRVHADEVGPEPSLGVFRADDAQLEGARLQRE